MSVVEEVVKNRYRRYDAQGKLVEEREATLEDLMNILLKTLSENYVIELNIATGKGEIRRKVG